MRSLLYTYFTRLCRLTRGFSTAASWLIDFSQSMISLKSYSCIFLQCLDLLLACSVLLLLATPGSLRNPGFLLLHLSYLYSQYKWFSFLKAYTTILIFWSCNRARAGLKRYTPVMLFDGTFASLLAVRFEIFH